MKCCVPDCNNEIPIWREEQGLISCSKKCVNAWNWIPQRAREEIRGKRYGHRKIIIHKRRLGRRIIAEEVFCGRWTQYIKASYHWKKVNCKSCLKKRSKNGR